MRRAPSALAISGAVLLTALLAACGGTGGSSGSADRAAGTAGGTDRAAPSAKGAASGSTAEAPGTGGGPVPGPGQVRAAVLTERRALVRKAAVTVRVKDVAAAARQASDLAVAAGGLVGDEQTSDDPGERSRSRSTLTLLVPSAAYSRVLSDLGRLGIRLDQSQSTDDVTSQVVDVDARLSAQRASVARVQALLSRARTLGEIVQVEGELTRRQADLESLESQQKALSAQTSLATIVATLQAGPTKAAAATELGFGSGLRRGWDAFVAVVLVGLTVVGVALPFLVTAALLAALAWRVTVGLHRRPGAAEATPPAEAA